jgi:hypothetical protein
MPANATKPELKLPPMPKTYKLRFLWVAAAMRRLAAMSGIKLSIDGAESASVGADGSLMFKVGAGGGAREYKPFQIHSDGKIEPGYVGSSMPFLDGEELDTTTNKLDLTAYGGDFRVYFKLNYTLAYTGGYLTSRNLDGTSTPVTVETYAIGSPPTDSGTSTTAIKYIHLNTITGGRPGTSNYSTSIPVYLADNGLNATTLIIGTFGA